MLRRPIERTPFGKRSEISSGKSLGKEREMFRKRAKKFRKNFQTFLDPNTDKTHTGKRKNNLNNNYGQTD